MHMLPMLSPKPGKRVLFTDGSCVNAKGWGGGHAVIEADGRVLVAGETREETTAQREELRGVIRAVEQVRPGESADIWSDSDYVVKMQTAQRLDKWREREWRDVANVELVQQLDALLTQHAGRVRLHWIRGHSGHPIQDLADAEARAAMRRACRSRPPQAS